MDEKAFKKMKGAGALNIVFGIVTMVFGIATGVILVVSGARLLAHKSETIF